jgi:hypothetical protein
MIVIIIARCWTVMIGGRRRAWLWAAASMVVGGGVRLRVPSLPHDMPFPWRQILDVTRQNYLTKHLL